MKQIFQDIFAVFRSTSIVVLLFLQTSSHAQTDKVKKFFIVPACNYMWQGTHNIDFGLQPMLLLDAKKDHSNVGLLLTCNVLFYNGSTYLTPVTKLRIMPHKRKILPLFGWFASVGHSFTNIQSKYDHRITPELGVKWSWFNLSAGYNIPVSAYHDNFTTSLRLVFGVNLF